MMGPDDMRYNTLVVVVVGLCWAAAGVAAYRTSVSPRVTNLIREDQAAFAAMHKTEMLQGTPPSHEIGAVDEADSYSYATATQLFWHSVSAYCKNHPDLQNWNCTSCQQFGPFTVTSLMTDTTNQGYVGYFTQGLPSSPIGGAGGDTGSEPYVLVSFRGTVPEIIADWIEDLTYTLIQPWQSLGEKASIHEGFHNAFLDVKAGMLTGIAAALNATGARTIIFTGHSLGASMAEVAALDTKLTAYPDLNYAVYTQGTPRTGDLAFSQLYASMMNTSFREVHQADIVPHLPPMSFGYEHTPTEIFFNEAFASFSVCNQTMSGEQPNCSDSILLPISITDHTHYRGITVSHYCGSSETTQVEQTTRMSKE